ncbi:MAG: DUF885 family protein, partial [Alphaproteobacteria bacterium]|nr:DUF885 family protein [Alphaproteobacteria bacterium]
MKKLLGLIIMLAAATAAYAQDSSNYDELLLLFADWREFESPPRLDGAPDYTKEQFAARHDEFSVLQSRLSAFDTTDWPVPQQVDWHLVRAEMNGYDFNARILQPWVRDPAFYKTVWTYRSDVPAHEGPTHHALVELWTYEFPLSDKQQEQLAAELAVIPPLTKQAQRNLTGNARELWVAGIRDIRQQSKTLQQLKERTGESASADLTSAIGAAIVATDELAVWLEAEATSKTGPSGIGKENYSWYLQ